MKTTEAAKGKWLGILTNFGIDESFLRNRHGACPLCGGNDRFRWDDKDGSGSYICNQCGAGTGMGLLMEFTGWDFKTAAKEVDRIIHNVPEVEQKEKPDPKVRISKVRECLTTELALPIRRYLSNRGVKATSKILCHPGIEYFEQGSLIGTFPAMVLPYVTPQGKLQTFHITHLTQDGRKADVKNPRKVLPPVGKMQGGAIRLTDVFPHIGVAEGVETALAVITQYGIPCWSVVNATLMESFVPPEGVKQVSIFGDNDKSFTGQKAAYVLANRLYQKYQIQVCIPEQTGTDFADIQQRAVA